MTGRIILRNKLTILMLFSFLYLSLFGSGNSTIFAQNYQGSNEAPVSQDTARPKLAVPNPELYPPTIPVAAFPFATNVSVMPGDSFVDINWTPFWKDDTMRSPGIIGTQNEIAGYLIHYGKKSKNYTQRVDAGAKTSYRIRGLNNFTTYFFAIQAYTEARKLSDLSEEVSTTPKPEEDLMSLIEKGFFEEKIPQVISRKIRQFGYDFFRSSKTPSFTPLADAPVGPDYIIGPGDGFTISLWGRIEAAFSIEVDRNGEITLPKVGTIKVWRLTFSELKETVHNELSKYYSGFRMNITMDRLRTIRVFVVGEVQNPGSYTLSSVSTVYNALISVGGPSKKGTMRGIQLIRKGNIIKHIDLYEFLLKGDKSQDERLQSGDTIFVPVIGDVVGITGNIKRPSVYEMKEPMNLNELIDLAGGVTFLGYLQRVQVERIEAHQKRIVADFDISGSLKKDIRRLEIPLRDGDMVKIFPILPTTQGIVRLEGHVYRPGGYEFREGMRLLDLIPSFDQLLTEPYLDYAEIVRLIPPDLHPETISFNLGRLLSGDRSQNIELMEYDRVTIYSREDLQAVPRVTIGGEIQRPGKYRLLDNMKVKDLIYNAGNLKRSAYLPEAEITRLLKTKESVISKVIHINLAEAINENPKHNIPLVEDDYLLVRQIPDWYTDRTITLQGEVRFPGVYSISKGERLSSAIIRAGGFTEYAYLKGAFFTRESAKKVQKERIKGFVDQLEEETLRTQASAAEGAVSEEDIKSIEQSLAAKRELMKKLKAATVTGRVVIFLDSIDKFEASKYDMELESGDTLAILKKPGIVSVLGSVYNPTSILHTRGKSVSFYLNKVGGPTPDAEKGEIYIVKADGTVLSRTQKGKSGLSWDSEGKRWMSGGFMSARIDPGDTILVPHKISRFIWKKEIMDWTQVLFQIAVSAGVVIAAF